MFVDDVPNRVKLAPYRVVGEVNPRQYFGDSNYPATVARIEIGFQLQTGDPYEYYWFNWIEPEQNLLCRLASGRYA